VRRNYDQLSFTDKLIGPGRSRSDRFFQAVDQAVDWGPIEDALKEIHAAKRGRPGITPLLLFKVLLIQRWYDLSDPAAEDALNDRKSFARFVGLPLDEPAPDHSSISRFRTELLRRGLMAPLSEALMAQIEAKGLVLKHGTLMDASFVLSAARPPGAPRKAKAVAEAPAETEAAAEAPPAKAEAGAEAEAEAGSGTEAEAQTQPASAPSPADPFAEGKRSRVDPDARWAKKGAKAYFGYKLHLAADEDRRIVRAHRVTAANVNDCQMGPALVQADGGAHYADKGYPSEPLRRKLAGYGLADGIMQLGTKHRPLRPAERRRNRTLAGIRSKVEGVFGEMKQRLGLARARYFGLDKVKLECDLVVFCFNLKTMALAAQTS
jgi:IS5 family transposase